MHTLIVKLGATGDVVRTTPLLRRLEGHVTWLTASKNMALLEGLDRPSAELRVLDWNDRSNLAGKHFDLVINLEDEPEIARILHSIHYSSVFGAYEDATRGMSYSPEASNWFDLSLISHHGK